MIVGKISNSVRGDRASEGEGGGQSFHGQVFFLLLLLRKKQRLLRRKDVGILFAGLEL